MGALLTLGIIVLFMGLIVLFDWLGERQEKRTRGSSR